jgi:subtilisin family serine protease
MCCAGIIGALGQQIPPGLAGESQLVPVRVLGAASMPGRAQPVGIGAIADIDAGLKMAVDLGAKVLNLSFGTPDGMLDPAAPKPHADVVRYALARGAILVAASGNSGREERYWPAAFDGVIAVGSVDAAGRRSAFTTSGPHVAICAPGERVVTTSLAGYQLATGTSFAAPFVAAVAALLVARAERRSQPIDGTLVRSVLCAGAAPFAESIAGYGSGVLDAYAALRALDQWIDTAPPGGADDGENQLAA